MNIVEADYRISKNDKFIIESSISVSFASTSNRYVLFATESKLNVSARKLFTLSTCPKTKVPVVTSIDDARCPSGLYPGDYLTKVNEINVIKSKFNIEEIYALLDKVDVTNLLIFTCELSMHDQTQIIKEVAIDIMKSEINIAQKKITIQRF